MSAAAARGSIPELARRHLWMAPIAIAATWMVTYLLADDTARLALYGTFGAVVFVLMGIGIRLHRPRPQRPWLALWAGIALLAIGDVGWCAYDLVGEDPPFPSVFDIAYLAGYVAIAAGVLSFFRGRIPGGDRGSVIDALILACGAGILAWIFLMAPYLGDESLDAFGVTVAMAYPLMDVLLLGVVARVLLAPTRREPAFMFLLGFLGLFTVTDFVYGFLVLEGTYATGALDLGWIAGAFSVAAATLHPSMRRMATSTAPEEAAQLGPTRIVMLGCACLLAPGAFVIQEMRGQSADLAVVIGGWVVLFVLVLARLSLTVGSLRTTLGQRRQLESELEFRAHHDGLTGLANRHRFGERLEAAIRGGGTVAVLFVDLDDFKIVNDTLGHETGDELLVAVAARIHETIRPSDVAARLGGDEFAILLTEVDEASVAESVGERILEALANPIEVHGHAHQVGASIGIAVSAPGEGHVSELMRNADIAMYIAKGKGKQRMELFQPALHAAVVERLSVPGELQRAIQDGRLVLHYQPIFGLDDGSIAGVEALVRWAHPTRGLLRPADFIPTAESTGQIVPIGRWVIDEAIGKAAAWRRRFGREIVLSVDLSAAELEDPSIVTTVRTALIEHGLPPKSLVLELTESLEMERDSVAATLDHIHALGVRVAIDDFGTGYSSLGSLGRLNVDFLKMDRAFVDAIASDGREAMLGAAIVQLGAALGLPTVAEGIDSAAQLARLRELGVQYGQGFLLDAPMSADAFAERLAKDVRESETRAATDAPRRRRLSVGHALLSPG